MAVFDETKTANAIDEYDVGSPVSEQMHASALGGTSHDALDMHRMGKKQELRVSW